MSHLPREGAIPPREEGGCLAGLERPGPAGLESPVPVDLKARGPACPVTRLDHLASDSISQYVTLCMSVIEIKGHGNLSRAEEFRLHSSSNGSH